MLNCFVFIFALVTSQHYTKFSSGLGKQVRSFQSLKNTALLKLKKHRKEEEPTKIIIIPQSNTIHGGRFFQLTFILQPSLTLLVTYKNVSKFTTTSHCKKLRKPTQTLALLSILLLILRSNKNTGWNARTIVLYQSTILKLNSVCIFIFLLLKEKVLFFNN